MSEIDYGRARGRGANKINAARARSASARISGAQVGRPLIDILFEKPLTPKKKKPAARTGISVDEKFYVVVDPGQDSMMSDCKFETTIAGLGLQFLGGLNASDRPAIYFTDADATIEAVRRMNARSPRTHAHVWKSSAMRGAARYCGECSVTEDLSR